MTYAMTETSTQDGAPIECYRFVGSFQTYRYTSYQEQVSVSGELFSPTTIERNAVQLSTQEENQLAMEITLPYQLELVRDYAYQEAPPELQLQLLRVHDTDTADSVVLWDGVVTGFTVEGFIAKLRVPSVFDVVLAGNVPGPKYQAPCNHAFTDIRCGISEVSVSEIVVATQVGGTTVRVPGLTLTDSQVRIGRVVAASGESRMITRRVGDDLTITYPFSSLTSGETVTIVRGCDHSFETCRDEFNNRENFGGFNVVPNRNPFTSKI